MKRAGMSMIEVIFAIVIIAISVITIPAMMGVANDAAETQMIDEDVLKRMMGEIVKVSKARWDQNYQDDTNAIEARYEILQVATGDCVLDGNGTWRPKNEDSNASCRDNTVAPSSIGSGDLNLTKGIEQLNSASYSLPVDLASGATAYTIPIAYAVRYVNSAVTWSGNTAATSTWRLGSSGAMAPDGGTGPNSHLKRVTVRVVDTNRKIDMTLSFFKSNVGKF